jgi:hypothetical protein
MHAAAGRAGVVEGDVARQHAGGSGRAQPDSSKPLYPRPDRGASNRQKGRVLPPDRFEIVVRGELTPTFLAGIDGFDATYCTDGHTHLVGEVPDQTRIRDLFNRFLELDIELVSVNPVTE